MNETTNSMDQMHDMLAIGEQILLALGVLVLATYWILLATKTNPKKRYDFINRNEIRAYKAGALFIVIALVLLIDDMLSLQFESTLLSTQYEIVELAPFIGGAFVIIMIGVLVFSGLRSMLNVYYPRFVGKRLDRLRYSPRISQQTGNAMKLLNEDEEDVHLTEEMRQDEESLRYDYDVWLDEQSGEVQIEKYDARLNTVICPDCKFRTLKDVRDEMISTSEGQEVLKRDYLCSYCGYEESKEFKVSTVDAIEKTSREAIAGNG